MQRRVEYSVGVNGVPVTRVDSTDGMSIGRVGVTIISVHSVELTTNGKPLKFANEQNVVKVAEHLREMGLEPLISVYTTTIETLD